MFQQVHTYQMKIDLFQKKYHLTQLTICLSLSINNIKIGEISKEIMRIILKAIYTLQEITN